MDSNSNRKYFSGLSGSYDRYVASQNNNEISGYLDTIANDYKDLDILDLGCGTGNFGAFFLKNGCTVWGLDHNQELLTIAAGKGIIPIALSIQNLDELEKTYDVILIRQVFQYLDNDVIESLKEKLSLIVKKGSSIVSNHMSAPDRTSADAFKKCMKIPNNSTPYLLHKDYINLFSGVGCVIQRNELSGFLVRESIPDFAAYRSITQVEAKKRFRGLSEHECFGVILDGDVVEYMRYYSLIVARFI